MEPGKQTYTVHTSGGARDTSTYLKKHYIKIIGLYQMTTKNLKIFVNFIEIEYNII